MANPKSDYRDAIIKLKELGHSYNEIAEKLGCSKSTVSYHLNPETKKKVLERSRKRRANNKKWWKEYSKDHFCQVCQESESVCLDYHHIFPEDKFMEISKMVNCFFSKEKILEELEKCICICANCHRKVHADIIDLEKYL